MTSRLCKKHEPLGFDLNMGTLLGEIMVVNNVCCDYLICIDKAELKADLLLLPLREFDVILRIDWLTKHHAIVNCFTKKVIIESPNQPRVIFLGERQVVPTCLISAIKAFKMVRGGCEAYLAHVMDTRTANNLLKSIPVVREFLDIFPKESLGLPPKRKVEFTIELLPGVTPISISPYSQLN